MLVDGVGSGLLALRGTDRHADRLSLDYNTGAYTPTDRLTFHHPTIHSRQGSNQGLRFMFFNEYKSYVTDHGKKSMNPGLSFLGGMLSGCFSTLCNNPLDVIKTRMQGTYVFAFACFLACLLAPRSPPTSVVDASV